MTVLITSSVTVPLIAEIVPLMLDTLLTTQLNKENRECAQPFVVSWSELPEISDNVSLIELVMSSSPLTMAPESGFGVLTKPWMSGKTLLDS